MSKELSTIEMLQDLCQGQQAYSKAWDIKVKNDYGNIVVMKNADHPVKMGELLTLSNLVLNTMKWKIVPKQISFNHAINLIKENKSVTCLDCDGDILRLTSLTDCIQINDIIVGKWYEGIVFEEDLVDNG